MKNEELPRDLKKAINRHLAGAPRRLATFAITLWRELLESRREIEQMKHEAEANLRLKDKALKSRTEQCRKQLNEIEKLTTLLKKKPKTVAEPQDWEAPLHLQNNQLKCWLKVFRDKKQQEGADFRKGHTQVAIKCPECGLHFMVFTWWLDRLLYGGSKFYCPQCGGTHCGVIQTKISKREIFQVLGSENTSGPRGQIQMKRQEKKRNEIHR